MKIDGKKTAKEILDEVHQKMQSYPLKRSPCLSFILVGDHAPSRLYVKMKEKACKKLNFSTKNFEFSQDVDPSKVLKQIELLNDDTSIDGILVQMPLPKQFDTQKVVETIDPRKDVDGFHPFNMGRLLQGAKPFFIPCTPLGVHELLIRSEVPIAGQHVVIMGRSNLVGKPLAALLMQKEKGANATVTLVNSYTKHVADITSSADILIAAMGSPQFVKKHMVKKGAVVIDVGINRVDDKLLGDVDFQDVYEKCAKITPVPGGVGPMTIAMLLSNTFKSYLDRCLN